MSWGKIFEVDSGRTTRALWEAWKQNDLELICAHALSEFKPIAVTLESRKVYVGMVADTIEPSDTDSYLSILPLYSGYRDRDDQTFCLNHRYNTLIDGLIKKDESVISQSLNYMIAIPAERIITVHVFNEDLYQEIAGHPTEAIGDT